MLAAIAWDQTLFSLLLAAPLAFLAYRRAAHVLHRQERRRWLQDERDALQQVLLGLEGPVATYLAGEEEEYPQREMVELERRALQAQVHCLRDLGLQKALRDICYPQRHQEAVAAIRVALEKLERDIAAVG